METEKDCDGSALTPTKRRSVSPIDPQNHGSSDPDMDVSLHRQDHTASSERVSTPRARRSQSMDDVRIDDVTDDTDTDVAGSDKIYRDDDGSGSGNGENGGGGNFMTDREEIEVTVADVTIADDDQQPSVPSESATENVRIIPVVRASSFKEAMRCNEMETREPGYSRMISQPLPTTNRDSRSSWVMPVFPSLEEIFNEWFTSAMSRTGSLGSSSSTPRVRTRSETSTPSVSTEGHGVPIRRSSRNSTETSPLHTPEFHEKRLSRLFNWQPTHLGPISGSSDSLDSAETADDWVDSRSDFLAKSRLPPGFETGFSDRDFGFRPSLLSRMSQPLSESQFSRQFSDSVFSGNYSDAHKTAKTQSESSQSGSTSRVIPVKVVSSRSSFDVESAKAGSGAGDSQVKSKTGRVTEDDSEPVPVFAHKTVPSSTHSSQFMQHNTQLPAGFLTGSGASSIPDISDADVSTQSSKVDGRPDAENERKVRVIPISHERNTGSRETPKRIPHSTRGRVIPVMVQSSVSVRDDNPTSSETTPVRIPVTVVQSESGAASNSPASENVSEFGRHTMTGGKYLPLCYDDEEGETVKKILQEMTIRRLPIRDTVRLLNMKTSRSMDFLDPKQQAGSEESPSGSTQNMSVDSPTVDLLPVGFWVGNSAGTSDRQSSAERTQTSSAAVTGNLIRKRLHQFSGRDANS